MSKAIVLPPTYLGVEFCLLKGEKCIDFFWHGVIMGGGLHNLNLARDCCNRQYSNRSILLTHRCIIMYYILSRLGQSETETLRFYDPRHLIYSHPLASQQCAVANRMEGQGIHTHLALRASIKRKIKHCNGIFVFTTPLKTTLVVVYLG